MYLSTITLKNFRKYAYDGVSKHGITVNFHKGLNALIGENDSGKSAIIDAIKLGLQTQSGEFTRVTDEDFYISAGNVKKCAVGKYPKSEKPGGAGQAAVCACARSRYFTGGSPSGLRV